MKRSGVRCHIVGVTRRPDGSIHHVAVEHLAPATGVADRSVVLCDVHSMVAENSAPEVFDAIHAIEGDVATS